MKQNSQVWVASGITLYCLTITGLTQAQIVPDTSFGSRSSTIQSNVLINGLPSDQVGGGVRRGANLFHSFQEFNLGKGKGVYFTNPDGVENILSRVTGGDRSNIQGTLGVLGDANLFLINPNGILFGPNASLDLKGSFVSTTANAIRFGKRGSFSASSANPPSRLLTIEPSALVFNQIPTQVIRNRSNQSYEGLKVADGRSLLLVGGDVRLSGGILTAPSGRVELGGVAGVGAVGLNIDGNNLSLSFPDGVAQANVFLTNGALVAASGEASGSIQIQGRRVILTGGSTVVANNFGSQPGGSLSINASESIKLTEGSSLFTGATGTGAGSKLTISTRKLTVQDGAFISTNAVFEGENQEPSLGIGQGGNLAVTATDFVLLTGKSSLFTQAQGRGNAGDLTIETGRIIIRDGAKASVSSLGLGNAGNLEVSARSILLDNQAALLAVSGGEGGNIQLQAQIVRLQQKSNISTTAGILGGPGNGGNITITTGNLSGSGNSDITANAFQGEGGNIKIRSTRTQGLKIREQLTDGNDITAFSQNAPNITPNIDPSLGLVPLPEEVVDVSGLVVQSCPRGEGNRSKGESQFIVTGRGGLPPTPKEALKSESPLVDLGIPVPDQEHHASRVISTESTNSHPQPTSIVEAQGWAINDNGEVLLTTQAPTLTPHSPWLTSAGCHAPEATS